jgi:hypothetical protein
MKHQHLLAFPLCSAILKAEIGALVRQSGGALYVPPSEAGIREDRACLSQVPPLTPAPFVRPGKRASGNMIGRR